jgi:hypothetical protein
MVACACLLAATRTCWSALAWCAGRAAPPGLRRHAQCAEVTNHHDLEPGDLGGRVDGVEAADVDLEGALVGVERVVAAERPLERDAHERALVAGDHGGDARVGVGRALLRYPYRHWPTRPSHVTDARHLRWAARRRAVRHGVLYMGTGAFVRPHWTGKLRKMQRNRAARSWGSAPGAGASWRPSGLEARANATKVGSMHTHPDLTLYAVRR